MTDPQAKTTSALRWILGGCAGLVVLGVLCAGGFGVLMMQGQAEVKPVADLFVGRLVAEDYEGAYESIGPEWKAVQSKEQFEDTMVAIHGVMGPLQNRNQQGLRVNSHTGTSTAVVTYAGTFEKGPGTIKASFSDKSGTWRVIGWRVESPLFAAALTCPSCKQKAASLSRFCPSCAAPMFPADAPAPAK